MRKDEKIEFRCTAELKRRLLACRHQLGTRFVSDTTTALVLAAIAVIEGRPASAPALREITLHLNRMASALQRHTLTGKIPDEYLREVETTLSMLYETFKPLDRR